MRLRLDPHSGLFVVVLAAFILAAGFSVGMVARRYGLEASAAVVVLLGAVALVLGRAFARRRPRR